MSVSHWHACRDEDSSPSEWLHAAAKATGHAVDSAEFAAWLDESDPLRAVRDQFHIPEHQPGQEQVYLCGNSLGPVPRATAAAVQTELQKWALGGVSGHFTGELPWATCEEVLPALMADVVGAEDATLEVAAMNSLTVNLHMLMASFYRPSAGRAAILIEAGAFPSDRIAVVTQLRNHGLDPRSELIEVPPRADGLLHTADMLAAIEEHHPRLGLVLLGGVNYLTGQVLEMGAIAAHVRTLNAAAQARGAPAVPLGLDLAHAVGNVPLSLHEWGVDFAAWCTYKYLNAGAGCLGAIFVHSSHAADTELYPRLSGWWGVPFDTRFAMAPDAALTPGASGFGCSNVNPLLVACLQQSLLVLQRAGGVAATRRKSLLLTAFLELLLHKHGLTAPPAAGAARRCGVAIVTPAAPRWRGCQLSLRVVPAEPGAEPPSMRALERSLRERGVSTDAREPDIVRISPAPLFNSFDDVRRFIAALTECLGELA